MRGARPEMQDVVLDEDGAGSAAPATPGPRAAAPPAGRRRLHRLWPWGAALLLAAGVATVDRTTPGGEPEPLVAEGGLDPVDGPVRELWRAPGLRATGLTRVDGLLVGTAERADDGVELVAVDAATGATVWTTPLVDGGPRHGGARCVTPEADADGLHRTVCVTADAVGPVDDFSPSSVVEPTRARWLVVDVATADVVREAPADPTTAVAALGADLAVSTVGAGGHVRVARTDVLGTTQRWSYTGPEPLRSSRFGRSAEVVVVDDLVVAGGESGWSLTPDGTPLHAWSPTPGGTGHAALVRPRFLAQAAAASGLRFRLLDLRSGRSFTVDGRPVAPVVDDGSAPDLVLAQARGDTLAAHTVPSGRRLWAAPRGGSGSSGLLVLGGRVIRLEDDAVSALDAATGEPLWSTPATHASRMRLATDGRVVLYATRDPVRGLVLHAVAVDDGRPRWDVDLPDDVDDLVVRDGRLFGATPDALVALG